MFLGGKIVNKACGQDFPHFKDIQFLGHMAKRPMTLSVLLPWESRELSPVNIKTTTPPFTVQEKRPSNFSVWLSFSIVDRTVDTPCLVRKGYLLPLSLLGFNRWLFSSQWTCSPLDWHCVCQSPRDCALPADKNWFSLGLATGTHSRHLVNVDELWNTCA